MPITYQDIRIPTCFATCSIGWSPSHTLPQKLSTLSAAGFDSIELSMPDIISYAAYLDPSHSEPSEDDYDTLVRVGTQIRTLAQQHNLRILMLQPFANFEGWPLSSPGREDAFRRAKGWMRIMEAVGTDMMQVGSSDTPLESLAAQTSAKSASSSLDDLMASDLAELADMFATKGYRIAYENWCWATRAPGWKDVWELVKKADRSNLGLCLDTFQSAGGEWADPTTDSGLVDEESDSSGGRQTDAERAKKWRDSLAELSRTVPADKIYLLQISDAYRMSPPLKDETDGDGLRPRGQWSHDHRPLPYDGGYLPVKDFLQAVLNTGFRGVISVEVFDGRAKEKHDGMDQYAEKGMASLKRLLDS